MTGAPRPPQARRLVMPPRLAAAAGPLALVVDGTGVLVRAQKAAQRSAPLSAADGTPTGALMMFIGSLAKKLRVARPDYVVVTWDGPDSRAWRRDIWPGYKEARPPQHGHGADQGLAMEFCEAAGIRQLMVPGFEADDLLAAVQRGVVGELPAGRLLMVSDDADLLQLCGDELTTVSGVGFDGMITAADVIAHWGVPPWMLSCSRALAGDASDGIPGLPGIGPARAAMMLARGKWKWPLPGDVLPGAEERRLVGAWHDVMDLITPPRRPEEDAPGGSSYFSLPGKAGWDGEAHRDAPGGLHDFLGKYQMRTLSGRLLKGRLW